MPQRGYCCLVTEGLGCGGSFTPYHGRTVGARTIYELCIEIARNGDSAPRKESQTPVAETLRLTDARKILARTKWAFPKSCPGEDTLAPIFRTARYSIHPLDTIRQGGPEDNPRPKAYGQVLIAVV